jgi:hypothetical protein
MRSFVYWTALGALLLITGCAGPGPRRPDPSRCAGAPACSTAWAPHHRKISTQSAEAQQYFDQGLIWAFAFNHDEAIRSFTNAGELDPACPMAWWGIALCHGPHINNPIMPAARPPGGVGRAGKRPRRAKIAERPVERRLVEALGRPLQRIADRRPPAPGRSLRGRDALGVQRLSRRSRRRFAIRRVDDGPAPVGFLDA